MNEKLLKSRGRDGAPAQSGDAFTLIGGAARMRSRAGRKGRTSALVLTDADRAVLAALPDSERAIV
jgi:hypothetical protein